MSPASYLTAPPRGAGQSIAAPETSKKLKARASEASYVGRKPASGRSRWSPRSSPFRSRSRASPHSPRRSPSARAGPAGRSSSPTSACCTSSTRTAPRRRARYFGWAVSELGDVDRDGVKEAIVGEPFSGPDASTGTTYVYSGRTGRLIYRFDGAAGDQNGFAMADAGDTNRDHVHDILVGSPGNGTGHVDLYSGRTGELLHRFTGARAGDWFGWSVSSAGDVDRDHHADVLVGATQAPARTGPGYATIYSGRTYEPIRTLTGDADRQPVRLGRRLEPRRQPRPRRRPDRRRPQRRRRAAAARPTSTRARPASGSSRSTPHRRAASSARSSWRASAT